MSIHDTPPTRQKAAVILSDRKLRMLEEAGLMVVEIDLMWRIETVLERAPGPWHVNHEGYTR